MITLTLSWRTPLSYRNQSIDLLCKSIDWFLHDNSFRHLKVKVVFVDTTCLTLQYLKKNNPLHLYINLKPQIIKIFNEILNLVDNVNVEILVCVNKKNKKINYNIGQNTRRLFHFLSQFYFPRRLINVLVASQFSKRLQT